MAVVSDNGSVTSVGKMHSWSTSMVSEGDVAFALSRSVAVASVVSDGQKRYSLFGATKPTYQRQAITVLNDNGYDMTDVNISANGLNLVWTARNRVTDGANEFRTAARASLNDAWQRGANHPLSAANRTGLRFNAAGDVAVFAERSSTGDDLYTARLSGSTWTVSPLTAANTADDEIDPALTADGCTVYFVRQNSSNSPTILSIRY